MKRRLSNSSNDNEPPAKRQKRNSTPPLSDVDCKEGKLEKVPTLTSNASQCSSASVQDNECCICFNVIDFPIKLDCGHIFCFLCLKEIRLQSSDTFNLADFVCDDTNPNNSTLSVDKNTENETFSCPYCRRKYDVTVIDKATMKRTDFVNDTRGKKEEEAQEIITWQYAGGKSGWWAYKYAHGEELENGYQTFLKQLKMEQEKEEKEATNMKDKYGFIQDADNDTDNNLSKEIGLLSHECVIEIGVRKYVIDYAQMMQFDHENHTKRRRVRRQIVTKQKLSRRSSLKGVAGKLFDDNKHNKNVKQQAIDF